MTKIPTKCILFDEFYLMVANTLSFYCMSVYMKNPYILNIKIIILQPILCF
jgi:hypothetical protein